MMKLTVFAHCSNVVGGEWFSTVVSVDAYVLMCFMTGRKI